MFIHVILVQSMQMDGYTAGASHASTPPAAVKVWTARLSLHQDWIKLSDKHSKVNRKSDNFQAIKRHQLMSSNITRTLDKRANFTLVIKS